MSKTAGGGRPGSAADVVRAGYDALGRRYLDWSTASPVWQRFLDELMTRLAPAAR